jgi:uncharacterized phage protein (TIGR02220 family)
MTTEEREIYFLLYKKMNFNTFQVKYTLEQLALDSSSKLELTKRKINTIIKNLLEKNYLQIVRKGVKGKPTIYKIVKIQEQMCNEYVPNVSRIGDECVPNKSQMIVEDTSVDDDTGTNVSRISNECVPNVSQMCNEYVTPINDKDKDIDKDKENNIYSLVIDKLNNLANTKYKSTTSKTKTLIKARQNEGFELEDFYTVIEKKVKKWKGDPEFEMYLRPVTLFGNKFESYLNENTGSKKLDKHKKGVYSGAIEENQRKIDEKLKDSEYVTFVNDEDIPF